MTNIFTMFSILIQDNSQMKMYMKIQHSYVYIIIHFVEKCGLFEWKQICAGFSFIYVCNVEDLTIRRG